VLTDEQAARFCGCGMHGDTIAYFPSCKLCKTKRAELDELMRNSGVDLLVAAGAYLMDMGPCENADDGEPLCEYPECTYCAMAIAHDAAQRAMAK